jgi:excisionase family DNA binding protein
MANAELTTKEAAARLNVAEVTVRLWCRQKRFPHARAVDTPRGSIWYIPEKDLSDFHPPQPGRPKSNGAATKRASKKGGRK